MLPTEAKARKAVPIYSGFVAYFPRAIAAVAELSRIGNDQHNPGEPLHWSKEESADHQDALMRHLVDDVMGVKFDTEGVRHKTKVAWRAMADLEMDLEMEEVENVGVAFDLGISNKWTCWVDETIDPIPVHDNTSDDDYKGPSYAEIKSADGLGGIGRIDMSEGYPE